MRSSSPQLTQTHEQGNYGEDSPDIVEQMLKWKADNHTGNGDKTKKSAGRQTGKEKPVPAMRQAQCKVLPPTRARVDESELDELAVERERLKKLQAQDVDQGITRPELEDRRLEEVQPSAAKGT